jgi:hypothetical protein
MPLAIHSLIRASKKPKVKRYMMVAIIYFDYSLSFLNLSMYSPNYYLLVTTCAPAITIMRVKVSKRQIIEKELTSLTYLI